MPREWWLKTLGFLFLVAVCIYCLLPTMLGIPDEKLNDANAPWYLKILPATKLNLGLDLRGGVHIILGIEVDKAVEAESDKLVTDVKERLKSKQIQAGVVERPEGEFAVLVEPTDKASADKIRSLIRDDYYHSIEYAGEVQNGKFLRFEMKPERIKEIKEHALDQALQTIRNRVDEFGVAEPVIQKQSDTQILVQLPGVKDPDRAIQLLGKTALLEFKLVDSKISPAELEQKIAEVREKVGFKDNFTKKMVDDLNAALKDWIPKGDVIAFEREEDRSTGAVKVRPYLLEAKPVMTGDMLEDARVTSDQLNRPQVSLRFNAVGAEAMERVSGENIGRQLAILLDGVIKSAPVLKTKIPASGAGAVIELGQSAMQKAYQEATDLALVLRAGALPAPVQIQENRTVGATLGVESIQKGEFSMLLATIVVVMFMLLYYRLMGMIANLALVLNIVMIMGTLALFQATLTLPGIAGIVLTIGMAVDANVLINERIREEIRWGKGLRAALEAGYHNANLTIVDSNLTTAFAGFALYYFGTGPIRGFAVTLLIGILWSYFTALTVTKLVIEYLFSKTNIEQRVSQWVLGVHA